MEMAEELTTEVPPQSLMSLPPEEVAVELAPQGPSPSLMTLPTEVLLACIKNLNYEELLRLRRVCQPLKILAEVALRDKFPDSVREINETDFGFQYYIEANLPTTSIFLNNCSSSIFQDPNIPEFLRLYGHQITHVKVQLFASCISEQELHFYSSLPNLKDLEIQVIKAPPETTPFPPNLNDLKSLKLNDIQGSSVMACRNYAWELLQFCEHLDYLKSSYTHLYQMKDYIERRHETHPNLPNLRVYDMENFLALAEGDTNHYRWYNAKDWFNILIPLFFKHGVKLLNVHSDILSTCPFPSRFGRTPEQFTTPIVSLTNVCAATFFAELPNLEKLMIQSTFWSHFYFPNWSREPVRERRAQARWPKLKQMDLTMDGVVGGYDDWEFDRETTGLLNFLFDSQRQSRGIRDLAIRYSMDYRNWRDDGPEALFPWVEKVTTTCPLLTKLTLENWKGCNKVVVKLLEGFPLLEEIVLEACEQLTDSGFVDGQKTFFNLKKLKKLSLRGLHLMPRITDLAFQTVFMNLKIKAFYLTGERPLKSITVAGIESLITGDFNSSVEKFPFDGWSLDGVTPEAFDQLKSQFRASHML